MKNKIMLGGNLFSYALSYKEAQLLMDFSYDNMCRAIDTADVYSNGDSERFIGEITRGKRENWFIATKLGVNSNQKIS